jgi:predicted glutamine amidotransferase
MCELLGMNANVPTDICFSFRGLMQRGGRTDVHRDGWGVAFYEGKGCRAFHDPEASAESEVAKLLRGYSIKSRVVVSHIRQATHGKVCLENTHPFRRELWGRDWALAHNGKLKGIKKRPLSFYRPIGTTDSEHAFCWLLDRLRERFRQPPAKAATLARSVNEFAGDIADHGTFNMLLSDSRSLFTFCSTKLCWITRRHPFGAASLIDEDWTIDFAAETTPRDIVTMIATRPLTRDESWVPMESGEFKVFRGGLSRSLRH